MHTGKLFKRKLPCRNHAGCSLVSQKFHSFRAGYGHLRTGMKMKLREFLFNKGKYPHVLNDHCVKTGIIVRFQIGNQLFFQFSVLQQSIDSKVQLPAMNMGYINGVKKLFLVKILGICPGSEHSTSYINSIRSSPDCCFKSFIGTGRSQQFNIPKQFDILIQSNNLHFQFLLQNA